MITFRYIIRMFVLPKLPPRKSLALTLIVIIVVSTAIGVSLFPSILGRGNIGVIEVYLPIVSGDVRDALTEMVNYAIKNESIRAVVLKIDSPGGSVDAVQEIFFTLQKLRETKPVVASIVGFGTSGAYQLAVGASYIYTSKASLIGNIGVIGFMPPKFGPFEDILETGPLKLRGFSEKEFRFKLKALQEDFLQTVISQRGDRIKADKEELSKAGIYLGYEAVERGLADAVGSSTEAIEKAASLAGVSDYKVVKINDFVKRQPRGFLSVISNATLNINTLSRLRTPPAFYYIYVPSDTPSAVKAVSVKSTNATTTNATRFPEGGKSVVIDFAHKNGFNKEEVSILSFELAARGFKIKFAEGESAEDKYSGADVLIIVNPSKAFNDSELQAVRSLMDRGGNLVLIGDPTRVRMSAINQIASEFGIIFGNGYLYDLKQNDGNYRNIMITKFTDGPLTQGVKRMVLYTAGPIYSKGNEVAVTNEATFSSESEIKAQYSPIVFIPDKKVLAIGDFTFMTEPYCYTDDNYEFITNLAEYLSGKQAP